MHVNEKEKCQKIQDNPEFKNLLAWNYSKQKPVVSYSKPLVDMEKSRDEWNIERVPARPRSISDMDYDRLAEKAQKWKKIEQGN